jgi:hypothetical protein
VVNGARFVHDRDTYFKNDGLYEFYANKPGLSQEKVVRRGGSVFVGALWDIAKAKTT